MKTSPVSGLGDWLIQRVTAVLLLFFFLYLLVYFAMFSPGSYAESRDISSGTGLVIGASVPLPSDANRRHQNHREPQVNSNLTVQTEVDTAVNSLSRAMREAGSTTIAHLDMRDPILRQDAIERWENEGGEVVPSLPPS